MQTGHNKDKLSFVLLFLLLFFCLLKGIKEAKKSEKSVCSFADDWVAPLSYLRSDAPPSGTNTHSHII